MAGASRPARRCGGLLAVSAALAVPLAGCGGATKAPSRLVDGSRPPPVPAGLAHVGARLVLGRLAVLDRIGLGACAHELGVATPVGALRRIGVAGASVTFRRGAEVYGCDATSPRSWCGREEGRFRDGRLLDPRLDILCKHETIGFAWIQPVPGARWIAIREPSYTELYPVAGGLPVRVTTSRVHVKTSSATFGISQYSAGGRELDRRTLEAFVAG